MKYPMLSGMKIAPSCQRDGGGLRRAISHIGTQGSKMAMEDVHTHITKVTNKICASFSSVTHSVKFPLIVDAPSSTWSSFR